MSEMPMVRLKDGDEVPAPVATVLTPVATVLTIALRDLCKQDPIAFYELTMLARNPAHKLWSDQVKQTLRDLSLIEANGQPHDLTRQIILNAVVGDLMDMRVVSPLAEPQP